MSRRAVVGAILIVVLCAGVVWFVTRKTVSKSVATTHQTIHAPIPESPKPSPSDETATTRDPEAALKSALASAPGATKETALRAIFDAANPEAAARLTLDLKNAPPDAVAPALRSELLAVGVAKWSESDPAAAAAFLDQNADAITDDDTNATGGVPIASQLTTNWGQTNPQAAIEWAKRHDDARGARQRVIVAWWDKDPAAAEAYALAHVTDVEDSKLAGIIANRMALQDPQHATKWIAQLPDETRKVAEVHIAMPWAHRAPREASEWAMTLPAEERGDALGAVASQWARQDPKAAEQWLGSLNGAGRDEAVEGYAGAVGATDPATALQWSTTISDAVIRESVMQRVISQWMSRDPAAARDWVQRSKLSEEEKSQLLNAAPSG